MIIYNITIQVAWAVHDAWRAWLTGEYLPAILDTGLFTHYQLVRLMEVNEDEGATYAVQLYSDAPDKFDMFRTNYLQDIQKKEKNQWGENIFSFSSLMEVIN